jgi:hypothetical protein
MWPGCCCQSGGMEATYGPHDLLVLGYGRADLSSEKLAGKAIGRSVPSGSQCIQTGVTYAGSDNIGCVLCSMPKVAPADGFVKALPRFEKMYSLAERAFKLE